MLGGMVDPLSLSTERMLPGAHAGQSVSRKLSLKITGLIWMGLHFLNMFIKLFF